MRVSASPGFWLLSAASLLWIFGSLFSEQGSPSPLNLLRAVGFGLAAWSLRDDVRPRLLGAGLLAAGVADLLSFPTLLEFVRGFEIVVEGSEFVGSLWIVVLGLTWLIKDDTPGLASLRWAILLIGLTALYWIFASMNATDWVWIPGNVAAAAGAGIIVAKPPSD